MTTPLVLFEDRAVEQLWPISLMRPAAMIRCGGVSLWQWIASTRRRWNAEVAAVLVRPYLRTLMAEQTSCAVNTMAAMDRAWLLLNARAVLQEHLAIKLQELLQRPLPAIWMEGASLVAAAIPAGVQPPGIATESDGAGDDWAEWAVALATPAMQSGTGDYLFHYAHDLVRHHIRILAEHMQNRLSHGGLREVRDGTFCGELVALPEYVVCDASQGPIIIEDHVQLSPFVMLQGPLWIGNSARIHPHTTLRGPTWIGEHSRVAGEVTASAIESFSNKQHEGFLGHAYLGPWVNLGAGTTSSNLKNTLGSIRVQYGTERVDTGMQFFGCVVGDFAKTAIQTRILTGKLIGVSSMIYGTVTENVPDFVNHVAADREMTALDLPTAETIRSRTFARRSYTPSAGENQLFQDVFLRTAARRRGLPIRVPQV